MDVKESDILSDNSHYDTEEFLNDNLLDDIDLHDNNDKEFLNNIEKTLEKQESINNVLENDDKVSDTKNVENYSIEFKDDSQEQDIKTT